MTKTKRAQASPLDAFNSYFSTASQFGEERWHNSLYPALQRPTRYTALYNRYVPKRDFDAAVGQVEDLTRLDFPSTPGDINAQDIAAYIRKQGHEDELFSPPQKSSNGLLTHWNLDAASLLPVHILSAKPGERVLDLCAAPGGKSLALAQSIWPNLQPDYAGPLLAGAKKGALHSNELDSSRFNRLNENLTSYLPEALRQSGQQKVIKLDGTKGAQFFPLGAGGYDKVLLDAPCSSERHIVHAQTKANLSASYTRMADELTRWSPASSKRLAQIQMQLLLTALRAVRVGGRVVYATCSLSKEENEGVIEKVMGQVEKDAKRGAIRWKATAEGLGDEVEKALEKDWGAEKIGRGWIVLPDRGHGWGPLYFVSLTKIEL